MNPEASSSTFDILQMTVTAAAGLVGAFIGGWTTTRGQRQQHERDIAAEMAREARGRSITAAERCDVIFQELKDIVPTVASTRTQPEQARQAIDAQYRLLEELDDQLVYLTSPWRERLEGNALLMRDADELGSDGFRRAHYHSTRTVAQTVSRDSHTVLASFLRNESLPEDDTYILEYQVAHAFVTVDRDDEYAQEIEEAEQLRNAWRQQNMPDVVSEE